MKQVVSPKFLALLCSAGLIMILSAGFSFGQSKKQTPAEGTSGAQKKNQRPSGEEKKEEVIQTDDVVAIDTNIVNVDVVVIAERPKIGAFVDAMRGRVAAALGVSTGCVSIKGKTNEGVGETGRGALVFEPATTPEDDVEALDLDKLAEESATLLSGAEGALADTLAGLAGTPHDVFNEAQGGDASGLRVALKAIGQQQKENDLAVGGALAVPEQRVGHRRFDGPPQRVPPADLTVVHKHPVAVTEGVAIGTRRRRAGRGSDMRKKQA